MQANSAKNKGPGSKRSADADKSYSRNELLQLAKIADTAERFEDMAKVKKHKLYFSKELAFEYLKAYGKCSF